MADQFIALDEPAVTDKKLDTSELAVGANTVQRERINISDPTSATGLAAVTAANGLAVDVTRVTGNVTVIQGTGTNLKVDASSVAVPVTDNAGSLTVDGTVSITANSSVNVAQLAGTTTDTNSGNKSAGTLRVVLATDQPALTNKLLVTPDSVALPANQSVNVAQLAGTATSVNSGNKDAGTMRVTLATDQVQLTNALKVDGSAVTQPVSMATNTPVGNVAHDGVDSGAPVKVGFRADTTFQTAVSDGDRVDALADVYGVQEVRVDHPNKWSYHENSSSALTDTTVQGAPGAGLSLYVTDIVVSTGAATAFNIFFEESTTTTVLGPYYLEAVAGRGLAISFATPKKLTANTLMSVTTSAAIAHSIDVTGFIAP